MSEQEGSRLKSVMVGFSYKLGLKNYSSVTSEVRLTADIDDQSKIADTIKALCDAARRIVRTELNISTGKVKPEEVDTNEYNVEIPFLNDNDSQLPKPSEEG